MIKKFPLQILNQRAVLNDKEVEGFSYFSWGGTSMVTIEIDAAGTAGKVDYSTGRREAIEATVFHGPLTADTNRFREKKIFDLRFAFVYDVTDSEYTHSKEGNKIFIKGMFKSRGDMDFKNGEKVEGSTVISVLQYTIYDGHDKEIEKYDAFNNKDSVNGIDLTEEENNYLYSI